MMRTPKMIDVFNDPINYGIFSYLATVAGALLPWTVASEILDSDYHINHSAIKRVSPLVKFYLSKDGTTELSGVRIESLARLAWSRYGLQWAKRYAVLSLEYDPIENYSMTETETETRTDTGTVTNSGTDTGTRTRNTTTGTDTTASGYVYAFDQNDPAIPSPSDKQTSESDTTGTENETESGGHNETRTDNLAHRVERTHARSGNIGTLTTQEMAESELKLWEYDFFEEVYNDLDEILTIPIY